MLELIINKIKPTRENILKFTCKGLIYFLLMIKDLTKINDDKCKTVTSPFRRDRNPSFSVYRNQSNNMWYFKDHGNSTFSGDVFDFAASIYGLDIKKDFVEIMNRMWRQLDIDNYEPYSEIEKMSTSYDFKLNWNKLLGRTPDIISTVETTNKKTIRLTLFKKNYDELDPLEINYLDTYRIKIEVLKTHRVWFIRGYEHVYDNCILEVTEEKKKPEGRIWLAYDFIHFAKIYCPDPKHFRYVGEVVPGYYFGSNEPTWNEEQDLPLFIVGGEKDVLTLESHGFNACCFSSEVVSIPQRAYSYWWESGKNGWGNFGKLIMYDIDKTGLAQMQRISKESKIDHIILPKWLSEKGGKDISDFFRLGGTVEEFTAIFRVQIKGQGQRDIRNFHYP